MDASLWCASSIGSWMCSCNYNHCKRDISFEFRKELHTTLRAEKREREKPIKLNNKYKRKTMIILYSNQKELWICFRLQCDDDVLSERRAGFLGRAEKVPSGHWWENLFSCWTKCRLRWFVCVAWYSQWIQRRWWLTDRLSFLFLRPAGFASTRATVSMGIHHN